MSAKQSDPTTATDETKGVPDPHTPEGSALPPDPEEGVTPDDTPDEGEAPDESTKAGREAAKYRHRLRAAETERDAAREQLATFQRSAVEDVAAASGMKSGAALWLAHELPAFLKDDGTVDAAKVRAAVSDLREQVGGRPLGYVPSMGTADPRGPQPTAMEKMAAAITKR